MRLSCLPHSRSKAMPDRAALRIAAFPCIHDARELIWSRSSAPEVSMRRREALKLLGGLALCPVCAASGFAADAHWSYEGEAGPARWGELDAANRACSAGAQQSPVDVVDPIRAQLTPLKITWDKRANTIINNG